jgi:mRNA interferase YafQ
MKTLYFSTAYKRDVKRLLRADKTLKEQLDAIIERLRSGASLDAKWGDHSLGRGWIDHRDLHVKPDLLLIYTRPCPNSVKLVRIGNHANIGFC